MYFDGRMKKSNHQPFANVPNNNLILTSTLPIQKNFSWRFRAPEIFFLEDIKLNFNTERSILGEVFKHVPADRITAEHTL